MTLTEFVDKWYGRSKPVLVVDKLGMDEVLDAIEDGKPIPKECVSFGFDPKWSPYKCFVYLDKE